MSDIDFLSRNKTLVNSYEATRDNDIIQEFIVLNNRLMTNIAYSITKSIPIEFDDVLSEVSISIIEMFQQGISYKYIEEECALSKFWTAVKNRTARRLFDQNEFGISKTSYIRMMRGEILRPVSLPEKVKDFDSSILPDETDSLAEIMIKKDVADVINYAISSLPEKMKNSLLLSYKNYPYKESKATYYRLRSKAGKCVKELITSLGYTKEDCYRFFGLLS